jgi:YD repeat-containing protein
MAACYDSNDQLVLNKSGFARLTMKYDANGKVIEKAYYGTDDNLLLQPEGYAVWRGKYDERGKVIEEAYYGIDGNLLLQPKGFAVVNKEYDARGNVTYQRHLGTRLEPLPRHDDGCTIHRAEYDDQNRVIMTACYDSNNQLVLNKSGFARVTKKYDANGNVIEEAYYGTNGNLLLQPAGYAILRAKYDERGLVYVGLFDTEGKPARTNQNYGAQFGHSEWRNEYRQDGRLTAQRYSGFEPGWGYAEMVIRFDEQGAPVEASYFGAEGQPIQTEVIVAWIEPGNRAETMGMRVGDVLLEYNGEAVRDFLRFIRQREAEPADAPAGQLSVRRGQEVLTFSIPSGKIGMGLQGRGVHARAPGAVTAGARSVAPTSP